MSMDGIDSERLKSCDNRSGGALMKRLMFLVIVCTAVAAAGGYAGAQTYRVNDLDTLEELLESRARPGDIIEIEPGTYMMDRRRLSIQVSGTPEAPIIIRGISENGRRPVFDGSQHNIMRGIFYFEEEASDIILENLEISHARGTGRPHGPNFTANAATIMILGTNITIRNCYLHNSENGLFATRESDYVLVENCVVADNGRFPGIGSPHRTHGFYFNAGHQIVKNCYIRNSTDSTNFKSRGDNTIFAFNWVEEETAYALDVSSNNRLNTLWLGNVVMKRTYTGINQGRLLGVGDGTGVAGGTLVAANNTFITIFPRDFYFFAHQSSTTDIIFLNNVFSGPGQSFLTRRGQGEITGSNNWIQAGIENVPETLENSIRGDDPGFLGRGLRPMPGSPLIDAGVSPEVYRETIDIVLRHATTGTDNEPSPVWLEALEDIKAHVPSFEPGMREAVTVPRQIVGEIDIGAFEAAR